MNATPEPSYVSRNDESVMESFASRPDWLANLILPFLAGWPSPSECWIWTRSTNRDGYGQINLPRSIRVSATRVHRVMWMLLRGPIPDGFVVDHDGPSGCHNHACANPSHLQIVTQRHNVVVTGTGRAAERSRRTHCPRGHELTPENNTPAKAAKGNRECARCARERKSSSWGNAGVER